MLDSGSGAATYAIEKRKKEEEKRRKKKLATGARFEAKPNSINGNIFATSVMAIFVGFVGVPFTLGLSIFLAILAIPLIIIYYQGFAKPRAKKRHSHEKFYCPHCRNIFTGMLDKCPSCGGKVRVGLFKCENCGTEIAGKKEQCPRCGVGLYY